ncbi:MAG: DUF2490 domain-containing protein [Paludibacteraceae bacterium]|nr:DUF2490 domain-containing protein [Paludibacteraceae bacterium]
MYNRLIILIVACVFHASLLAQTHTLAYSPDTSVVQTAAQLRIEGGVTKRFGRHLSIGLEEELRLGTSGFKRSYTELKTSYNFNKNFKAGAFYSFILINGSNRWKTRHRIGLSATASVRAGRFRFSLRERPMLSLRTDSINTEEKNRVNWSLRSRLMMEYNIREYHLKPYLSVEVGNTLNAKRISGVYNAIEYAWAGNYIDKLRPTIGLKWTYKRMHEFDFFYKLDYDYDRDYNIKKKSKKLEVVRQTMYTHVIGVAYRFNKR